MANFICLSAILPPNIISARANDETRFVLFLQNYEMHITRDYPEQGDAVGRGFLNASFVLLPFTGNRWRFVAAGQRLKLQQMFMLVAARHPLFQLIQAVGRRGGTLIIRSAGHG